MKFKIHFPLALMAPFAFLLVLSFASHFMLAWAVDEPLPSLGASLMSLFTAIQGKAVTAVILVHVFQILRTNEAIGILGKLGLKGKAMSVAVAVLTTLGFVATAWATGMPLGQAAIEGLFTSGGAMLIFNALKAEQEKAAIKQAAVVVATSVKPNSIKA